MKKSVTDYSDHYTWKDNCIGFLRILLASLVLLGHAPVLGGYESLGFRILGDQFGYGKIAVMGFFTLSGLLITRSWESSKSLKDFFVKRVLRIFPGYWVCLLMVAFFFGPISWSLFHREGSYPFFQGPDSAMGYVLHNFTSKMNQDFIHGLYFTDNKPQGANFPLWTIISEFTCYVLTGVLGAIGLGKRFRPLYLVAMLLVAGFLFRQSASESDSGVLLSRIPHLLSYLIGVVIYYYHEKIPLNSIAGWISILLAIASTYHPLTGILFPFFFGYAVVVLGFKGPIRNIERKADYSYGVYMYGWPVQILLAGILPKWIGVWGYLGVTVLAIAPFAMASWYLVEKPAMSLKKHFLTPRPSAKPETA